MRGFSNFENEAKWAVVTPPVLIVDL
jgi:hypothetical protein